MVTIEPVFANRDTVAPVFLRITIENGKSVSYTPLALKRGSLEVLLPFGEIKIEASAVGQGRVTRTLNVSETTKSRFKIAIPQK